MNAAPDHKRRPALSHWRRWLSFLLAAVLVLVSLPVFATLALAFRLWTGPIDITSSARRLLARDHVQGLSIGRVRLAWNGWAEGPGAPLGVLVDDAAFGQARIAQGFAALDLLALLRGHARILALRASDASVSLERAGDGSIGAVGAGPAKPAAAGAPPRRLDFGHLQQLDIGHGLVTLHDAASGQSCHAELRDVSIAALRLPAATGVTGQIDARLSCGGAVLHLLGHGREGPEGAIAWQIASDPFVPAAYAGLDPVLAPLASLDLPLSVVVATTLSGGFGWAMLPQHLDLRVHAGEGAIQVGGPDGLPVRSGSMHLLLDLPQGPDETMRVVVSQSSLVLAEGELAPVLQFTASLSSRRRSVQANLTAQIDRFGFADLAAIWPRTWAKGARKWITENITAGSGRALSVTAGLASEQGLGGLALASLGGGFDASDLTVNWLRPIAPVLGVDAHLVLEGPDALRISSRAGTEAVDRVGRSAGTISVGPTVLRITGLSRKDQFSQIDTRLHGDLGDVLALLAHPRLRLLSKHDPGFRDPSGASDIRLSLQVPLLDQVNTDDLRVHVDAALSHVHLGHVVAGRDLDGADLRLAATEDGMRVQGSGALAALPIALSYSMDFRSGGPHQVTDTAHVTARIDRVAMQREGTDLGDHFDGSLDASLDYTNHRNGLATVASVLDLTDAALDTPVWRKPRGVPAEASGTMMLQDQHLSLISLLHVRAPGLLLDGHAETQSTQVRSLVIDGFTIGRSQGAGRIEFPGAASRAPLRIALHGPVLDIAPLFAGSDVGSTEASQAGQHGAGQDQAGPSRFAWRGDLAFRRVLFSPTGALSGVRLSAEVRGGQVSNASLAIDGPTTVMARLTHEPDRRHFVLDAADLGGLLATLGIGRRIEGGVLNIDGSLVERPEGMRLTALAKVGAFVINDAPLAARLARDLSGYGFLAGGPNRQLAVTRLEVPFVLDNDTLVLNNARASSAALGATLRGSVNLRQETLDLRGTVVPGYVLNALPGALPGLGRVFSPEKGGGLLAATLRITGPLDKPDVSVNPLALLAPGILRRLLFN